MGTPRAWRKLTLSFGLVSVPIAICPLTEDNSVRGKTLCAEHRLPVSRTWRCEAGEEVTNEGTVIGYAVDDDYVVLPEGELAALVPVADGVVTLDAFVPEKDVDPVYYDRSYLSWPTETGLTAYVLFRDALRKTGRVAVGKVLLTKRERLCVVRYSAVTDSLIVHVCSFHADLRQRDVDLVRGTVTGKSDPTLLKEAVRMVEALSGDFRPEGIRDAYSEQLRIAIEAAARGTKPRTRKVTPKPRPPADLLAQLRASMEEVGK